MIIFINSLFYFYVIITLKNIYFYYVGFLISFDN